MSNATQAKVLLKSLSDNCELAMQLVDTLLDEQACLIKMNTEELVELSVKKEGMMFDLEKRFRHYLECAVQQGFEESPIGLEQWVELLNTIEPTLNRTFGTLKTTLEQAKRLNTTNGELVAQQLVGIRQRIDILTAAAVEKTSDKEAETYSAKGGISNKSGPTSRAVIR